MKCWIQFYPRCQFNIWLGNAGSSNMTLFTKEMDKFCKTKTLIKTNNMLFHEHILTYILYGWMGPLPYGSVCRQYVNSLMYVHVKQN